MNIPALCRFLVGVTSLLLVSSIFTVYAETIRYEFGESSRSVMRIGPNQTLDQLVEQLYPGQQSLWPRIKQEIKQRNPDAFNRYTGNLVVGQRLKLVTVRKIREGVTRKLVESGRVTAIQGKATATDKYGKTRQLAVDEPVFEGDRLETSIKGVLSVRMIDDAEMHLKNNSALRISEYEQKGGFETGSRSILDLIRGGLRKISGAIGANPLSVYKMRTGVATIGIRGTDYVLKLCKENDCEQAVGRNDQGSRLHVAVLDGVITIEDEEGVHGELALGQYAVASPDQFVLIEDSPPVKGLLNEEEKAYFDKLEHKKDMPIWPWLLGGALLGL
jgi:hypothetical protein